jgi:DNA sulfur modification protein DndD
MKLLSLAIHNIGLYAGLHHFDLTTQPANDPQRNIVLFRGHNGAGKSTLFTALGLAFHGQQSLGDRVSHQQYNDYLLNKLHRCIVDDDTRIMHDGQINVRFEYIQSGRPIRIRVERQWHRNGVVMEETLNVASEDEPLELDSADYQHWLNDLLAPGSAALCFFDAERLDALSSLNQNKNSLRDTLSRLLGLDLVGRLLTDLNTYTARNGDSTTILQLHTAHARHNNELIELDVAYLQNEQDAAEWAEKATTALAELRNAERQLAQEGGSYAARRPMLQERLVEVRRERETLEGQIREIAGQLLPFTLAPALCQRLSTHLKEEAQQYRRRLSADLWQQAIEEISIDLAAEQVWTNLKVADSDRMVIRDRFIGLLRAVGGIGVSDEARIVHQLAEIEHGRLQEWIVQARNTVPQQIKVMGDRLSELQSEQKRLEEDIQRAPADEAIAPHIAEISRLENLLNEADKKLNSIAEKRGSLAFRREEKSRILAQVAMQLEAAARVEQQVMLATRSKIILRTYQEELTRRRLAALQERLVANFNLICRKKALLPATSISPKDFAIELRTVDGKSLSLNDFSAGERQLYVLALLQAFRQVSGQQLPLLIDTPLARLDNIHRQSLLADYFPMVSDQVLLFATEAELDETLMRQIRPYLVREYSLSYDPERQQTQVRSDTYQQARSA